MTGCWMCILSIYITVIVDGDDCIDMMSKMSEANLVATCNNNSLGVAMFLISSSTLTHLHPSMQIDKMGRWLLGAHGQGRYVTNAASSTFHKSSFLPNTPAKHCRYVVFMSKPVWGLMNLKTTIVKPLVKLFNFFTCDFLSDYCSSLLYHHDVTCSLTPSPIKCLPVHWNPSFVPCAPMWNGQNSCQTDLHLGFLWKYV